jgi:hypothetical protein
MKRAKKRPLPSKYGRRMFELTPEQFRLFLELLNAPMTRNPGLDRLMAIEVPWERNTAHPQHIRAIDTAMAHRMRALTKRITVDLDAVLDPADE